MKALVIGYGSIGRRHAANLVKLGHEVVLLRHQRGAGPNGMFREYFDLDEAVALEQPDFAVVASPTPCHADDACRLIERSVPILLEKPPAQDCAGVRRIARALAHRKPSRYDLGFNLRWYPALRVIKGQIATLGQIFTLRAAAGSFLPAWRPGVDYRRTTSARAELGGGVHIELVHEIDYILWLLGMPARVVAHVARVGRLEISSADLCSALLLYVDGSVVELHLDYLSHKNLRGCQIIAERGTLEWNLSDGRVVIYEPGSKEPRELLSVGADYDMNQTYLDELRHFICVAQGTASPAVEISHGINVMTILQAIITSSATGQWYDVSVAPINATTL